VSIIKEEVEAYLDTDSLIVLKMTLRIYRLPQRLGDGFAEADAYLPTSLCAAELNGSGEMTFVLMR
jgi:hypothetical protein